MDVTEPVSQVIGNELEKTATHRSPWPCCGDPTGQPRAAGLNVFPWYSGWWRPYAPGLYLVVGADARDAFLGACEAIERLELPARVLSGLNPAQPYDDEAAGIHASRWSSFSEFCQAVPSRHSGRSNRTAWIWRLSAQTSSVRPIPLRPGCCAAACRSAASCYWSGRRRWPTPLLSLICSFQIPSLDFYHAGGVRIVHRTVPKGKLAALLAPREKNERAVAIARALLARLGEGLRASLRAELGWAAAERLEATLAEAAGRAEATAAEAGEIARVRALWDQERAASRRKGRRTPTRSPGFVRSATRSAQLSRRKGRRTPTRSPSLVRFCDQERAAFEAEGKTHADEIARLRALCDQERAAFEAKEVKFGASQAEAPPHTPAR